MPINFGLLEGLIKQPQNSIIPLPGNSGGSGGGDDIFGGISSLFSGLKGMVGATANTMNGMGSNPNVGTGQNTLNTMLGANQQQGLQGVLQQGTTIGDFQKSIFGNAQQYVGQKEGQNTLTSYLQKSNPKLDPATTPWCAGFVNSVLNSSGVKGTGSLAAKSYLNYGTPTNTPGRGDIAVFNDLTGNDPKRGHIGFVESVNPKTGMISVLGGNQNNSVSIQQYPIAKVAGFRVPPSGQQVQQFAQQNRLTTPQQLAELPKLAFNNPTPIKQAINGSRSAYADNPIMADVAASQAILESRLNGKPSGLAVGSNNYFGIKGKGTQGSTNMPTSEYIGGRMVRVNANFAKNASPAESFEQHKKLMSNPRYKNVINAKSPEEAFQALQKAGYATDPTYAKQLTNIYNKYIKGGHSLNDQNGTLPVGQDSMPQQQTQPQPFAPGLPPLRTASIERLDDVNPRLTEPQYSNMPQIPGLYEPHAGDENQLAQNRINWGLLQGLLNQQQA